ncbi:hypothetical protein SUGI_0897670 [Cryptomeria japonica]|nr:hypothetical protein SUGI_0897670 [Cryptomeria japonica]
MWVNLFFLLLVGLQICSAARLMVENNDQDFAPQTLKAELAFKEAAEMKFWSSSGNIKVQEERVLESTPTPGNGHH